MEILVRRSKTDQKGASTWIAAAIRTGPVFRPLRAGRVLEQRLSGHSLRAGFVTSAARAGKSERAVTDQTGHRSVTIVRRYFRRAGLFELPGPGH